MGKHILRSSAVGRGFLIGHLGRWPAKTWSLDLEDLWQAVFDCVQLAANRFEGGWAGEVVSNRAQQVAWSQVGGSYLGTQVGSWGMRYLPWPGAKLSRANVAPMAAPVVWSQQALGIVVSKGHP